MDEIEKLSDEELRAQLKLHNYAAGPITDTTRRVYQLKLSNCISSISEPAVSEAGIESSVPSSSGDSSEVFSNQQILPPNPQMLNSNGHHTQHTSPHQKDPASPRGLEPRDIGITSAAAQKSAFVYSRIGDQEPPSQDAVKSRILQQTDVGGLTKGSTGTPQRNFNGFNEPMGPRGDVDYRSSTGVNVTSGLAGSGSREPRYSGVGTPNLTSTPQNYSTNASSFGAKPARQSFGGRYIN